MKKEIKDYIKQAYKWYEEKCSNYIPDTQDIAECVADFIEDDTGLEISEGMYEKILKAVEGKE